MIALTFSHFSTETSITPYKLAQKPGRQIKPRGLWLSVDGEDDWASWCEAEQFDIGPNRFRVTLRPGPLLLTTPDAVLDFTREYELPPTRPYDIGFTYLDWQRVSEDHPGVIIAPYQWSLRLDDRTFWYYGWDCASGVVWDTSIIESVELMPAAIEAAP